MPYIKEDDRVDAARDPANPGELTFAIQQLLRVYINRFQVSYRTYAECLGALRGAELDLWDRKLQPYEVIKRDQNGDVW